LNIMGYVDLHSHVLPALDDGATDLDSGLTMLRTLAAVGFDTVTATPHQKASQFLPTLAAVRAAHAEVTKHLAATGVPLRLALAAENFWDDVFYERWRAGAIPSYDDGRAFLFEIAPEDAPASFEETLFQIELGGKLPVLAHPERYRPFWNDVDRLAAVGQRIALVVDLGALAGYHGWKPGRVARALVAERVAHAAASDVHSPSDVRAAAEGIAWIKKKLGPDAVRRLLDDNPRAILGGQLPDP
jgi:protein-tyrosine phosphatase